MGNQNRQFPLELLDASINERVQYFREYIVSHEHLRNATNDALDLIRDPDDVRLLIVMGATAAGKTTMQNKIEEHLNKWPKDDEDWHPGRIPVLRMVISNDEGAESFTDIWKRLLGTANEVLIDKKVGIEIEMESTSTGLHRPKAASPRKADWRKATEDMLKERQPYAVLFDEAQHLLHVSAKKLTDQLDTIKSIAVETGQLFVLFGTYELIPFMEINGQLDRRSDYIELKRYDYIDTDEKKHFKSALKAMQAKLPLKEEPNLLKNHQYFWEGSLGSIGMLKQWLTKALRKALKDDEKHEFYEYCKRTRTSNGRLSTRLIEIKEGEEEYKKLIGDNMSDDSLRAELYGEIQTKDSDKDQAGSSTKKGNTRPGVANPKRHPVGT